MIFVYQNAGETACGKDELSIPAVRVVLNDFFTEFMAVFRCFF